MPQRTELFPTCFAVELNLIRRDGLGLVPVVVLVDHSTEY